MAKRRKKFWEYTEFEPISEEDEELETPLTFWEEQEILRKLSEHEAKAPRGKFKGKPPKRMETFPKEAKPAYILPPPPKEPRKIRLVAWDLDDTLWYVNPPSKPTIKKGKKPKELLFEPETGRLVPLKERKIETTRAMRGTGIISSCGTGYRKISDTVIKNDKCTVVLKPGVLETLKRLKKKGIYLTTASLNNYKDGVEALRAFGLADMFIDLQIGWGGKDKMLHRSLDNLRNRNICIRDEEVMFLDDSRRNLEAVHEGLGGRPIVLNSESNYHNAKEIFKWIR